MNKQTEHAYDLEEFLTGLVRQNDHMCGYQIRTRCGYHAEAAARRQSIPAVMENMPDWMVDNGQVAPESQEAWRTLFATIERGDKAGAAMVSLRSPDGSFTRQRIQFNGVADADGTPLYALLFFWDLTAAYEEIGLQRNDLNALLQAARKTFQEILVLNLTQNTYRILQYDSVTTMGAPRVGVIDSMVSTRLGGVAEEDRDAFSRTLSGDSLRRAFTQEGKESVQQVYRRPGQDGKLYWYETLVTRLNNSFNSDMLAVAMSHNVDDQKAQELRMQEQLRVQAEEISLTMSQIGKVIHYYDIPTRTLTMPPLEADKRGIPHEIPNFPECLFAAAPKGFPPATMEAIRRIYDSIRAGAPTGSEEYCITDPTGGERWMRMEFAVIFDDEKRPIRAVMSTENVTDRYAQARELEENERLLRLIAQHTDRTIFYYDLHTQTARLWEQDDREQQPPPSRQHSPYSRQQSLDALLTDDKVLPESKKALAAVFRDINAGTPKGGAKIQVKSTGGENRWFDLQYSTVYDSMGKPTAALISHKDVTAQYEHELAYRRLNQSMADSDQCLALLDVDLVSCVIERQSGALTLNDAPPEGYPFSEFIQQELLPRCREKHRSEVQEFFSSQYLIARHNEGYRQLECTWQMRLPNDTLGWVRARVDLMTDPYAGHTKAFFRMIDVTDKREAQLELQRRSERDGMTGLLNRTTAEARIRAQIAESKEPGILILLDLDDLKGINDSLGHREGDRAIVGIAETLKAHFREGDIMGRFGGDEFIIYLRGAAGNQDSIAASVSSLLWKLAGISLGENGERVVHCSIGCAVQTAEADTFDILYKQADRALYHVKRNGKNNYAFYTQDMEQADYQFQQQEFLSMQSERKAELERLQHLLSAISAYYPLVLTANLSTNDYNLMADGAEGLFPDLPACGTLDAFTEAYAKQVHPTDALTLFDHMSRQALLQAYARGEKNVRCSFRFRTGPRENFHWAEATVILYTNARGDVCSSTLVRWVNTYSDKLEKLGLQNALEMAVTSLFEYVCLVNTEDGRYFRFGPETDVRSLPKDADYDAVVRQIRDELIVPEQRDAFYEKAKLPTVRARIFSGDDTYTYRCTLTDGEFEVSFHTFEPTRTHLLLLVYRFPEE